MDDPDSNPHSAARCPGLSSNWSPALVSCLSAVPGASRPDQYRDEALSSTSSRLNGLTTALGCCSDLLSPSSAALIPVRDIWSHRWTTSTSTRFPRPPSIQRLIVIGRRLALDRDEIPAAVVFLGFRLRVASIPSFFELPRATIISSSSGHGHCSLKASGASAFSHMS